MSIADWVLLVGTLPVLGWTDLVIDTAIRLLETLLVWPLAAVAIALLFRKPLTSVLKGIRVGKLGSFEVWVERAQGNAPDPGPDPGPTPEPPTSTPPPPTTPSANPDTTNQWKTPPSQPTTPPPPADSEYETSDPQLRVYRDLQVFLRTRRQTWRLAVEQHRSLALRGSKQAIVETWYDFEKRVTSEAARVGEYCRPYNIAFEYPVGWRAARADLNTASLVVDAETVRPLQATSFVETADRLYESHLKTMGRMLSSARNIEVRRFVDHHADVVVDNEGNEKEPPPSHA